MKLWVQFVTIITVIGAVLLGFIFVEDRYQSVKAANLEKKAIRVEVAQTAASIQSDVSAIRLQQMQWELDDIMARAEAGKMLPGDESRKVVLIARIEKLVTK